MLSIKELIDTGIFTALMFLICVLVMPIGFLPILMPLYCVFIPFFCAIPWIVFSLRNKKFGPVLLMSILLGLLLLFTGMGIWSLPVCVLGGVISEIIRKKGNYTSLTSHVIAHGFFSLWVFGSFIPLIFFADSYWSEHQEYGSEFIADTQFFTMFGIAPCLIASCIIFGILGGFVAKALVKKHFRKAGII